MHLLLKKELNLSLKKINISVDNKKILLNNLNDFFIQIDYFDQNGTRKRKNKLPLYYILNPKINNTQTSV